MRIIVTSEGNENEEEERGNLKSKDNFLFLSLDGRYEYSSYFTYIFGK